MIITYYWPPSGGSAVLRWFKFTKYLREFGWEPVIYTPLNPEPQEYDESLLNDIPPDTEIIKTKIIEPYSLYKIITGKKQSDRLGVAMMDEAGKKSFLQKLSVWIRSNLFIPDPRVLWVNPSVRFLIGYLKKHPVDAVITTGPPHSMHLIGLKLKKRTGIKWVADFRDPWTNIDFYSKLKLTRRSDKKHRELEKSVLKKANHVITVSPGMTAEFKAYGISNISTITNGFDEQPLQNTTTQVKDFVIVHLGSMPESRNPEIFWKAVSELLKIRPEFKASVKIRLIGKIDSVVRKSLKANAIEDYVSNESYIPHSETLKVLCEASALLLVINNTPNSNGILTNKFFEYLSAKRPIIAVGPVNGDAAEILRESNAGRISEYDDADGLKNYLSELFDLYSQNKLVVEPGSIEKYSRKYLTSKLAGLLNDITSK